MNMTTIKQFTIMIVAVLMFSSIAISAERKAPAKKKTLPPADALRDPFWRVDWEPENFGSKTLTKTTIKKAGLIKWAEAKKKLKIIGLGRAPDGRVLTASVRNIGLVEKNDRIKVSYLGLIYQWKVIDISNKGSLSLEQIDVKPVKK